MLEIQLTATVQEAMKEVQPTTPPSEEQQVAPSYQQLRARTPSQFPTELVPLGSRVREGNFKLELIRRGTGMFRLLEEAKHDKVYTTALVAAAAAVSSHCAAADAGGHKEERDGA